MTDLPRCDKASGPRTARRSTRRGTRYWVSRRFYVTITGKGAGQTPFNSLSPGARNVLLLACAAVAVVIVYFYALLLYQ